MSQSAAKYLTENKAWNWQWPDDKGRWQTKAKPRGKAQAYHGPSKRTVAKRAAKARRRGK